MTIDLRCTEARSCSALMQSWPALQRWICSRLVIAPHHASFETRGFRCDDPELRRRLERVGGTFLSGFNSALIEEDLQAVHALIERTEADHRGFAVEGAAMGAALRDAVSGGGRLRTWMAVNEARYTYLVHIGAGWALARMPWRRGAISRHLDPIHHWLLFEGAGFERTFFRPRNVLAGWRPWRHGYAARACDQGIGRALWFVAGGNIDQAVTMLRGFASSRQDDLWSGFGLALAYAGGARSRDLRNLLSVAGRLRPSLLQGAAFAAEAHYRADHVPVHTAVAVRVLTGCDTESLSRLVRAVHARLSPLDETADIPAYEIWRRSIQAALSG